MKSLVYEWTRFGFVGLVATGVYLLVSHLVVAMQFSVFVANLFGYLASVGVSYFGHSILTFRSTISHAVRGPKFLAVSVLTYVISNLIVLLTVEVWNYSFLVASIVVACSIPLLTWVLSRYWIFR